MLFIWGLYYAYHYWGGLGPGRIQRSPRSLNAERPIECRKGEQEMLAARIIMGVAVLNLVFLFSALAMNVARVYFG